MSKKTQVIGVMIVLLLLAGAILAWLKLGPVNAERSSLGRKVTIGVILPLTGSGAVWGENAKEGIDLALEEINQADGIDGKPLEVKFEDSQTLPKFAVTALHKHINVNRVEACIVDMVSSNVLAMAPIANREQVVLLSPGASSPKITNAGSFIFRNWPSDALQGQLNARYAVTKMAAKNASIFYINNEYGSGLATVFEKEFTKHGGKVIAVESFEQGAKDFRSVLSKLKVQPVGVLYVLSYPKEWPLILVQAKELGLTFPILGTETAEDPTIIVNAKEAAEGLIYSVPSKPSNSDARVAHFLEAYKAKYGKDPGICADAAYDALYLLVDAIRNIGYDGPAIRDYLFKVKDYHGAAGLTTFDENGDCIKPFIFKKVENGVPVAL